MKFGLFSLNFDACSYPETATKVAQAAEAAGFESLWVGERLLAPDPRTDASPTDPHDRMLDPIVSLGFLAAVTKKPLLGTGVVVLPQRQPIVMAKQLASLDALSNGRILFGIGAGYLEQELNATGVQMSERGARTDEYLRAMRTILAEDAPTFHGRFVSFQGVSAYPRRSGIPVIVGGESTAALRPADLGPLEITVSIRGRVTRDLAAQYAEAGVDRIIVLTRRHQDEEGLLRFVDNVERDLLGAPI